MFSSLDSTSWLMTTPTKCGTLGIQSAICNKMRAARFILPGHGWIPYPAYRRRILIVRDPVERMVSTYWYLKSLQKPPAIKPRNFKDFMAFVASEKSKAYIVQPLSKYLVNFKPDVIIRLEFIGDLWDVLEIPDARRVYGKTSKHPTRGKRDVRETWKEPLTQDGYQWLLNEYEALRGQYEMLHSNEGQ